MNLSDAIEEVNAFFEYEPEAGIEKWRVLNPADPEGDCEDYALTVIWHASDGSLVRFLLAFVWTYRLWAVTDPNGNAHMVCVCSEGAFDNHRKQITAVSDYKARGYTFRYMWLFPLVWVKLLIGRF